MELKALTRVEDLTQTLVASTTETATSTGSTATRLHEAPNGYVFLLDVTAAATDAGDLLDAFIQTRLVSGTWTDIAAFTQVTGDGGAKTHIAKVVADGTETMFENGAALSAGSVRNLLGDEYRARWDVTDAGTDNASFTFSIHAIPM